MRFRLHLVTAAALLTFLVAPPALASEASAPASASPSGESHERPNVGDKPPHENGFGESRGVLNDEEGLLALGLAFVIGASTAIVVIRRRNKQSLY